LRSVAWKSGSCKSCIFLQDVIVVVVFGNVSV